MSKIKILQNHIVRINSKIMISNDIIKAVRLKKHVEILEEKIGVLRESLIK